MKNVFKIFALIIFFYVLYSFSSKFSKEKIELKRKEILYKEYSFTIGSFVRVGRIGVSGSCFVIIDYSVDGKDYKKTVINDYYDDCRTNDLCKDKKFWVIYLNDNPNECLVDLVHEIQNDEELIPPLNLREFK